MAAAGNDHLRTGDVSERPPIEDDPAVQVRSPSDARAVAVATVALLLVSLVALASGGSPWHAGGRHDVPAGLVSAFAAVAGALLVGSLLLVWVGTPSVEKRRRRRRRLDAKDLEGIGASLSTAGRAAAIVVGASHAGSTRWLRTLATLADAELDSELPGVIVVGAVVELATQLANDYAPSSAIGEQLP